MRMIHNTVDHIPNKSPTKLAMYKKVASSQYRGKAIMSTIEELVRRMRAYPTRLGAKRRTCSAVTLIVEVQ